MQYRILGKTSLHVSVIGLGTWQFGGEWGKSFTAADVAAIVHRAGDLGINLIDTAECYGDHLAESLIGPAIAGRREKWFIATKFGHKFHGMMNRSEPRSGPEVMQQLEDSLRALGTDYVDIYQYHSVRNSEFDDVPLREALQKAKKQGKIRHIGVSISPPDNMHQTDGATAADVEVIQVLYNRLERKAEAAVLPSCQRQNLGVLARVPLASGYLSGKYQPGVKFAADDWRSGHNPADVAAKLTEVARIMREEVPPGVPVACWALAWCLKNPAVTSIIPGCKTVEQLEANCEAVGG
ncbi:MAG: aldo/keto reductase [Tepidisphaeraceae bacterium]|jgi:aryl-alcohol dehydrogenase-like predicted oxidoreductase